MHKKYSVIKEYVLTLYGHIDVAFALGLPNLIPKLGLYAGKRRDYYLGTMGEGQHRLSNGMLFPKPSYERLH